MKIIVFGATGGTGQFVVEQGIESGFEVTAFVRHPKKLSLSHINLNVVQGDAFNETDVSVAIAGHDAVVSCLGSSKGMKKSTELQKMAKNIATGMKVHDVNRIIYVASAGIHNELTGISGRIVSMLLKNPLIDHRAAFEEIKAQGLNYTIARPMSLSNRQVTGEYREAETGVPPKASSIPRADVAHFIIKALKDSNYGQTSIGLTT